MYIRQEHFKNLSSSSPMWIYCSCHKGQPGSFTQCDSVCTGQNRTMNARQDQPWQNTSCNLTIWRSAPPSYRRHIWHFYWGESSWKCSIIFCTIVTALTLLLHLGLIFPPGYKATVNNDGRVHDVLHRTTFHALCLNLVNHLRVLIKWILKCLWKYQ